MSIRPARVPRRRRHRRQVVPGSAPGQLRIDPSQPAPRLRVIAYGPGGVDEAVLDHPDEVKQHLERRPVTWLNVDGLGHAQTLMRIGEIFRLHRLALEDVANVTQRPKVDRYGEQFFISARMVARDQVHSTELITIVLGPRFVVTFQEREGDWFDAVRDRIRHGKGLIRNSGTDYLTYAVLDAVVDSFYPELEKQGDVLDELEAEILRRPEPEVMERLFDVKRHLLALRRACWPQRESVGALLRVESPLWREETRTHLRDCYDHAMQVLDLVETHRELASGLMDLYVSMVGHRMNEIMKVLTIMAAIFIPLTFIAGIYGMNFDTSHPWNLPELAFPYGYPITLAVMALIAAGMVYWFKRKGWIGRGGHLPRGETALRGETPRS